MENSKLATTWVQMRAYSASSLRAFGHVTTILEAENRQMVANLNRYISISVNIDKNFVAFEHNISVMFFLLCPLTPTYCTVDTIFFHSFFFLFFLFPKLSTFKPLNTLLTNFKRLQTSWRIRSGLKLRVPRFKIPP